MGKINTQERNLLDFAERATRNASPYYAVCFQLARLADSANATALINILRYSIQNFARSNGAQTFDIMDDRIMMVAESDLRLKVNQYVLELETMLAGDARIPEKGPSPIELYDVAATPKLFLKCCEELYAEAREAEETALENGSRRHGDQTPITGRILDRLLISLETCDIAPMVRRQHVCAVVEAGKPKSLFVEYFVSMMVLSHTIAPGVSVTANGSLFRELTRALDKRFMKLLCQERDSYIKGPVSFNLNMSSLQSGEFITFLENVFPNTDKSLVVELDFMDVLEHLQDYLAVIPFLRQRGLKILIENLRPALLDAIDLSQLNADLYKIRWQGHYAGNPARKSRFLRALDILPSNRCVLTHCDSAAAIQCGRAAGLQAFQGFHVDKLQTSHPAPAPPGGPAAFANAAHGRS